MMCARRFINLSEKLTAEARKVTGNGEEFFELLPGVTNTLQVLDQHPRYQSALLTGNIEPMAYLKMELVGLDQFFKLLALSVRNRMSRRDLPERAAERISSRLQLQLKPGQFIVIGDTPNDIDCARHFGARAVVVGTGRFYSTEELLACKPDAWIEDLSDAELVVRTLGWAVRPQQGTSQLALEQVRKGGLPLALSCAQKVRLRCQA